MVEAEVIVEAEMEVEAEVEVETEAVEEQGALDAEPDAGMAKNQEGVSRKHASA